MCSEQPQVNSFRIHGVTWDLILNMREAVDEVVMELTWKMQMILRQKRFFSDAEVVRLFNTHLLSYI